MDSQAYGVGSVRCTRIADLSDFRMSATRMFAGVGPADLSAVEHAFGPGFVDVSAGEIIINFNAYVIDDGDVVVLVDPCIGDGKTRPQYAQWHQRQSDFLHRLRAAGYPPERIDRVVSTHLHADHVGWNTTWNGSAWLPTFPNATYLFVEPEISYWSERYAAGNDPGVAYGAYVDSVKPIFDAGVAETVPVGTEIARGVRLRHAPGHTPGNVVIDIDDGASGAVITGDVFHHPLQLLDPGLSTNFCVDQSQSRDTRRALLETFAESGALLFPAHFVAPSAGRIVRSGAAYGYDLYRGNS
jgi:glyoxylase-like metal-dependent hydrolase (beta-lactamase superfamily II)